MAIVLCLDEIMDAKGISVSELAREVGISRANMSNLKFGHVRAIRFSTLDRICEVLECQPGDLLKFEKEGSGVSFLPDGEADGDMFCAESPKGPSLLPEAACVSPFLSVEAKAFVSEREIEVR